MEHYGWDIYLQEGARELKRLIRSGFFGDKEAQKEILSVYFEIYTGSREHEIKGTIFYPKLAEDVAHKNASANIARLRKYLRAFYSTPEGKKSDFEIYFAAESRSYRLGIRPKIKDLGRQQRKDVAYERHVHFFVKTKPSIIEALAGMLLVLAPVLISLAVSALLIAQFRSSNIGFWISLLAFLFSMGLGYVGLVLYKLRTRNLAHLCGKYFLQFSKQNVLITSFVGKCPASRCLGHVYLSSKYKKVIGYIAKCTEAPETHMYSLDPITLEGERIKSSL